MAMKTILVPTEPHDLMTSTLETALLLARCFDSYIEGFALRPAGHQVLANVYRVSDLARSFEMSGGISFRGFVEELEVQAEKAESAEAPVLEEGAEGVRLMTVHSAKGLEFPIVILADMTANIAAHDPDRFGAARFRRGDLRRLQLRRQNRPACQLQHNRRFD